MYIIFLLFLFTLQANIEIEFVIIITIQLSFQVLRYRQQHQDSINNKKSKIHLEASAICDPILINDSRNQTRHSPHRDLVPRPINFLVSVKLNYPDY